MRIATFNLENLDMPTERPTFDQRAAALRPQLTRLRADVLCLQEVHGQNGPDGTRTLAALTALLAPTPYATYQLVSTLTSDDDPYAERNLVVATHLPVLHRAQYLNDLTPAPQYKQVTGDQPDAVPVRWERPILHVTLDLGTDGRLEVIVVHLKSKLPTPIPAQQLERTSPSGAHYTVWRTAYGWAEGFFLSSMKRVGQAIETRALVDQLFSADPAAQILVAGDFNADLTDVPVQAIRGAVEDTDNPDLGANTLFPCETTVPEPARFSLYHHGRPQMLDHLLVSRALLSGYRGTEVHNEQLHDESVAFATDLLFPESDHAPVVAEFDLS